MPERFGDHRRGAFGDLQIEQLFLSEPCRFARIVGGAEAAADGAAQVVHQHVMVFGNAGLIEHNALVDFDQADDLDYEAGLFADLPMQRFFETLADFDDAARQRPPAFERFAPTLDEQDLFAFDDQRADAQDRPFGILAANIATLP